MKLVLLETQNVHAHRNHRAEYFPFAAGLAELLGWEWRWLAVRVPEGHIHVGARFVVDLPEVRRGRLLRAVAAEEPQVVVTNDRPTPGLRGALEEAAPGARVVDLSEAEVVAAADRSQAQGRRADAGERPSGKGMRGLSVGDMARVLTGRDLGAVDEDLSSELLLDAVMPRFGRSYPCSEDAAEERLPVRLVVPGACQYRGLVRTNRFYRDLDVPEVAQHVGCSFCFEGSSRWDISYRLPLSEMALRQIEAEQRDEPSLPGRAAYLLDGNALYPIFSDLLDGLLERDLRPSTITGMLRVDQLLRLRARLEEVLPRLASAGHALRLLSMGAESFSEDENERFNKGLRVEQLEEAHELFVELEERFPDTFGRADPSTFAGILFTPWTRPEDLLVNIEAARLLGPAWLHAAVGTRLQLRPGLPITALARRDGLTADAHGSGADVEPVCLSGPDEREIPWRFADALTERIHQVVIRVEPIPDQVHVEADDPLLLEIRALRERLPEKLREDYVGLVEAVVRAVVALGVEAPSEEVLARAARVALLSCGSWDPTKGLDEHGAAVLIKLLDQLVARNERHLRGYRLVEATPARHGHDYRVCVSLRRDGCELRFVVVGRYAGNSYRLEDGRFAVDFEAGCDPDADEIAVARIVLRLAERSFPRRGEKNERA